MKSAWKVSSNPIAGVTKYQAFRIKDVNAVDHSGNREYGADGSQTRMRRKRPPTS